MYKIVKKEVLNDVVQLMEVHAPMVARKCEPGQFINYCDCFFFSIIISNCKMEKESLLQLLIMIEKKKQSQ